MFVPKALSYLGNILAGQAQLTPRNQLSVMPNEILAHIFRSLLGDSSAVHFSRVCKDFYSIYKVFSRPIDRLLSSDCKTIEFVQKNRIVGFVTHSQDIVITLDDEEYERNPRVTIWSSQKPPVRETDHPISSFFHKPIIYTAIGGTTTPYFAAAQYNITGTIQTWNLNNKTKMKEAQLNREISSLCGYNELLLAGFMSGTIGWYNFSDLRLIKELPAHDSGINFIFVDPSIKRMMTSSNNSIKIWDLENLNCIREITLDILRSYSSYDSETKTLIGVSEKEGEVSVIYFWSAQDGNEMASFDCPNEKGSFTGVHLNAKKGLLFAGYSYKNESSELTRTGMAVWDVKSKNLLKDFPGLISGNTTADLHDYLCDIDFDPDSGLIMTYGFGIHLWSLEKAIHIKRLDMPNGDPYRVKWDKSRHRLFAIMSGKLYLKDYSNNPLQIVGEVTH